MNLLFVNIYLQENKMNNVNTKRNALAFIGFCLTMSIVMVTISVSIFERRIGQDCRHTQRLIDEREGASWNSEYGKTNNGVAATISQC
jgi:hypothetical protein